MRYVTLFLSVFAGLSWINYWIAEISIPLTISQIIHLDVTFGLVDHGISQVPIL